MAATLTQERFTGPDWTFERKIDGIRLLAFKSGREVSLLSRTRRAQDPPLVAQELVVGGFTEPRGKRVGLGALLVGYYEGGDLIFAGRIGTGLDTRLLLSLRERLDALEIPAPPFAKAEGLPRRGAHWTRPEVVVQAAILEWTAHGKLRHPRLLGVRADKAPREVVREAP